MRSAADTLPRKTVLATVMQGFSGGLHERLALAVELIDEAAETAKAKYPERGLDLVILPETAIQSGGDRDAADRAVVWEGEIFEAMAAKARQHRTYLIVPVQRNESDGTISNAAILLDRQGNEVGMYRKVHVGSDPDNSLEGGVTPGSDFPVFECDFGRIGIQICWDMSYEDGWLELARKGAEIVALPTASPQTIRPASYALRGHYYVVNSTPRDNVTVFNPIGLAEAQMTAGRVLVHQIDLSYAILHWTLALEDGRSLRRRFGDRVGFIYSEREDTGIFWSNDPEQSIGSMMRELNLVEMQEHIEHALRLREGLR